VDAGIRKNLLTHADVHKFLERNLTAGAHALRRAWGRNSRVAHTYGALRTGARRRKPVRAVRCTAGAHRNAPPIASVSVSRDQRHTRRVLPSAVLTHTKSHQRTSDQRLPATTMCTGLSL
jgi:hypothetical protein